MSILVSDALYLIGFVGVFCLVFAVGEWLSIWAYNHIPAVKKHWDNYCENNHPKWEDE